MIEPGNRATNLYSILRRLPDGNQIRECPEDILELDKSYRIGQDILELDKISWNWTRNLEIGRDILKPNLDARSVLCEENFAAQLF